MIGQPGQMWGGRSVSCSTSPTVAHSSELAIDDDRSERTVGGRAAKSRMSRYYDDDVAYDEELAARLGDLLDGEPGLEEKRMFGGLAFLIGGNMAISASGQGGVLVRVDPAQSDKLIDTSHAELAIMRGRPMEGWLRVAPEHLRTKPQLAKWAKLGAACARSLPAKR